MPARDEAIVRCQPFGDQWQAYGADAARGVTVEGLKLGVDDWGPHDAAWSLARDPGVAFADLQAATPVEVEIGGSLLWSGRTSDTPTQELERQIGVQAEGWQFHTDDDAYQKVYLHTNLKDWTDTRQMPNTGLGVTQYGTQGTVSVGADGQIYIGQQIGVTLTAGLRTGVTLDLGPLNKAVYVALYITSSNNTANQHLYCRAMDTPQFGNQDATYGYNDIAAGGANIGNPAAQNNGFAGGPSYAQGAFANPCRYISIFDYVDSGYTPGADVWWKIQSVSVVTVAAYLTTGGVSVLFASDVIKDALTYAPLISTDQSLIASTSFAIPDLAMSSFQTPRQVISAVNAYHMYQARIRADYRAEFRPRPSSPLLTLVNGAFNDASAGSLDDIFNRCVGIANGPDGVQIVSDQLNPFSSTYLPSGTVQPTNPSADSVTTGWSATGTLTRDATTYSSPPASFKVVGSGIGTQLITSSWTGQFQKGTSYRLDLAMAGAAGQAFSIQITDGLNNVLARSAGLVPGVTFVAYSLYFSPINTGTLTLTISGLPGSTVWVDSVQVYFNATTIPDRRGFRKTNVIDTNMNLTQAALDQLTSTSLAAHQRTPFKGKLTVTGMEAVAMTVGGAYVPAWELLQYVGEMIHFPNLVDPDTGAKGRDGRISAVSYDHDTRTSSVSIDSQRSNFEALLARLQVVTGRVQ